jgi:hypothetical protein
LSGVWEVFVDELRVDEYKHGVLLIGLASCVERFFMGLGCCVWLLGHSSLSVRNIISSINLIMILFVKTNMLRFV